MMDPDPEGRSGEGVGTGDVGKEQQEKEKNAGKREVQEGCSILRLIFLGKGDREATARRLSFRYLSDLTVSIWNSCANK